MKVGLVLVWWLGCGGLCQACGSSPGDMNTSNDDAGANDGPRPRDDQSMPPIDDRTVLVAWLGERYYSAWACDGAARTSQAPLHARLRACRNDAFVHPPPGGDYHVGAAVVAELLDTSNVVIGHAALVRALPDPGATGWYFYEHFMPGAPLPASLAVDADGTLVAERGGAGATATTICTTCHLSAARDSLIPVPTEAM